MSTPPPKKATTPRHWQKSGDSSFKSLFVPFVPVRAKPQWFVFKCPNFYVSQKMGSGHGMRGKWKQNATTSDVSSQVVKTISLKQMRPMQYEILNIMNHYCLLNGAVSETVPVQHSKHAKKCLNESYLISLKISYHFISQTGFSSFTATSTSHSLWRNFMIKELGKILILAKVPTTRSLDTGFVKIVIITEIFHRKAPN